MVEIVRDVKEQAVQDCLSLGPDHEILGSYPWLEWLKKKTGNERLFAYYHRLRETFVLAVWVYSPEETASPVAQELAVFEGSPTSLWPKDLPHPEAMLRRLRPVDLVHRERMEKRKALRDKEKRAMQEDAIQKKGVVQYLRRKKLDLAAHKLETGATPFIGEARMAPGRLEEWKNLAKSAVRSL